MTTPLILILALWGQAALASTAPPELIPREVLFGNPRRTDFQLSPDGTRLGYLAPSPEGVMNIWVRDLETGEETMATDDRHRGIFGFQWAYDNRHLLFVQDRDGDENWHLHAADLETGSSTDLTPFPGITAQDVMVCPSQPHFAVVALNRRDPTEFDMYRIDLRTHDVTLEVENPGDVQRWVTDQDLRVRAASALDAETSDTILRVREPDGPWRDLVRWSFEETGSVLYQRILGFTKDGTRLFVQSPKGTDMSHLALMDVETGEEVEILAQNDSCDIRNEFGGSGMDAMVLFDPDRSAVQAVVFDYLIPEWQVLDDAIREDFETLQAENLGFFQIDGRDRKDRNWLVTFTSDTHPARSFLYDRTSGELTLVNDSNPALDGHELAPKQPVTLTARDGLKLPGYLTLPPGVEPGNLPLVLLPHGGPWWRNSWFFEPDVQHLANRGYAVLQVNFRGSTGYGRSHLNAGNGQWGVGSMQHDLTDAVQWAIDEGIADPHRIGIYGGSYGGYASLSGAAFTPDLYAAVVDVVGPSDVATLLDSFPAYWSVRILRWRLRTGLQERDDEFNRKISPLFHADRIRAPLLIGHGANDPRVKLSASTHIVESLQRRGMPVEFVVYPDEGHGFYREENVLDWAGRVEKFLAAHLGGRLEPLTPIEGSSALVKTGSR